MRYAIVETEKAMAKGLKAKWHRVNNTGRKMVANENELMKIESDPSMAASMLGGTLMELDELKVELNKWNEI